MQRRLNPAQGIDTNYGARCNLRITVNLNTGVTKSSLMVALGGVRPSLGYAVSARTKFPRNVKAALSGERRHAGRCVAGQLPNTRVFRAGPCPAGSAALRGGCAKLHKYTSLHRETRPRGPQMYEDSAAQLNSM